ncbi:MAG: type II toxin-antitoxin system HipA family toxin [Solirubrobacterales bacterium]
MSALDVHLHDRRLGTLERIEGGRLRFTYDGGVEADMRPPLSLSLPVRTEAYEDAECRGYFSGLLPEGGFLRGVARAFGVSASNAFSVLDAIGGECAGAVSLSPSGAERPAAGGPRWLDPPELYEVLAQTPERIMATGIDGEGLRLSLAGAQEKLPVMFEGGRVGVTGGDPPSTHIVKLPIPGYQDTVANENYCLALAAASGLTVAESDARSSGASDASDEADDSIPFLLVTRYDRVEGPVRRLHQEDLCQALGRPPEVKYEAEGGPSVRDCADLMTRHSAIPARDRLAFCDALLFNLVIGNHDAHSKNYSLLLEGPDTPRLASLYDLLSTAIYPNLSRKLAMRYGGEDRPGYIERRHLDRLAQDLGMRGPALARRAAALADRVEAGVPLADERAAAHFRDPEILAKIKDRVEAGLKILRRATVSPN